MAGVDTKHRGRRPAAEPAGGRKRKRRRKGNRTLYYILVTIFLLAAGIALSMTVFFKIESVTAVGVDKYPPDEIIAESGILKGDNLFRVNSKAVKEKLLKKYPYIAEVNVHLKLPHTIQLEMSQCAPAGALTSGNELLLITRDGKVLERGLVFIPEDVPIIIGVETGNAKPGDTLGKDVGDETLMKNSSDALLMLDYLFKAVDETEFGEITNVNLTDLYNMKIIYENRLLLNLGTESELPAKLNFLKEMIDNRLPKDAQGLIDASNIERSLIYTEMTIEEAERGQKRGTKIPESSSKSELDEPEPELDKQDPEESSTI